MRFTGTDNKSHFIEPKRLNERGTKSDVRRFRTQPTIKYQSDRITRNIVSDRQRLLVVKRNKLNAVLKALGL